MGMSFATLGLAAEFGPQGVAVNALWPRTIIATDALNMIPGVDHGAAAGPRSWPMPRTRCWCTPAARLIGQFLIDEDVLRAAASPTSRATR
jgi:citronellol/citronellal dehydrogenase